MAGSAAIASQKVWPMRSAESVGWPSRAATRWVTADSRVSWLRIIVRMKLVSDGSWRIAASASWRSFAQTGSTTPAISGASARATTWDMLASSNRLDVLDYHIWRRVRCAPVMLTAHSAAASRGTGKRRARNARIASAKASLRSPATMWRASATSASSEPGEIARNAPAAARLTSSLAPPRTRSRHGKRADGVLERRLDLFAAARADPDERNHLYGIV